jgi:hypothetical protein
MKTKTHCLAALLHCLALGALVLTASARPVTPPPSRGLPAARALGNVRQLVLQPVDAKRELENDAKSGITTPLRFALSTPVRVTPDTDGTWENVPGGRLWRLRVLAPSATDLNLGFKQFRLPPGATFHLYAEGEDYVQGGYGAHDNKEHGEFWSPVIPGDRVVAELFVPENAAFEPELLLTHVGRGYRDMFHKRKEAAAAKSGSCNINVVCPIGAPWSNEIRSAAGYSFGGSLFCSGTLINNAVGDYRPFFLTANHCEVDAGNAASVVVYWNFQSPNCGTVGGGSLAQNQSGAIFRSAKFDVDFTLLELEEMPDPAFNVYYAGWDRSGATPASVVGIHHPSGDEKAITFSSNALTTVSSCIGTGGANTHWRVTWSQGTTEPGSSGSAIWDMSTRRIVGFLSGGGASCSTPLDPDCYGKMSVAWASGTTPQARLREWLDPLNTGTNGVPGVNWKRAPLVRAASLALVSENCMPTNGVMDPNETVTIALSLRNVGLTNTANATATLLSGNGVIVPSAPQNFGVLPTNGALTTRSFTFIATGACGGTVTPTFRIQDGTNELGVVSGTFTIGNPVSSFAQNFDAVTPPVLPTQWTSGGNLGGWATTSARSDSGLNSAFAANAPFDGEATLTTPGIPVTVTNAELTFVHYYDTEAGWDGCVLDISLNNGTSYSDIQTAGGVFLSGGYNSSVNPDTLNPLAGRSAWSGFSGGFVATRVRLPASAANKTVRFRWRIGCDETVSEEGWYVDSVSVSQGYACCHQIVPPTIVGARKQTTNIVFSFLSLPGQTYVTEFKNRLATNLNWSPLRTNAGDGTHKSITNSLGAATNRFYRVRTQ